MHYFEKMEAAKKMAKNKRYTSVGKTPTFKLIKRPVVNGHDCRLSGPVNRVNDPIGHE